ncbi:FkbM family methyltransferase [Aliiroseovarius sp. S1339]|uniref:FkbM family methyltransferase n=1 Tax=Aliiroseovarius sp. S1339 TaxID=2936990 RepID=UPI0020BFC263|nr:FkbM family methyltransferase [Aliiroseovarius sp. S1339]MCK8465397.1 FkbM family methyltransferase [Aliiroseovarius sp. S1339]
MPRFHLDGFTLEIPKHCLNSAIETAIEQGHYEAKELAGIKRHLKPGDRVLDLGGGAGYLALQAAKVVGAQNVTTVEANPEMVHVIGKNLALNDAVDLRVLHGAVVADDFTQDSVSFEARAAFWASSILKGSPGKKSQLIDVPALKLRDLFQACEPSFVVMDVEGAEVALAQQDWVETVRLVIMEIHPQLYSPRVIQKIFDGLSRAGFAYMPWGSRGNVVVFQRLTAD